MLKLVRMRYVATVLLLLSGFSLNVVAQTVSLTTDMDDYWPGQWVIITGSGWQNDESVRLSLTHLDPLPDPIHFHASWDVIPDSLGNIHSEWFVENQELGTSFQLDALGTPTGNTATTYFTDANCPAPTITSQPQSQSVCAGETVQFSVSATGTGTLSYQWEERKITGNYSSLTGATSSTLTLTGVTTIMNGYKYRCVVLNTANGCTPRSTTTSEATLTVTSMTPSVSIAANPGTTICGSIPVTFTATPVNGGTMPVYQWNKNGNPVGSNSPTYTDNSLLNGDIINCVLTSNATCLQVTSATSNSIQMTVVPAVIPAVSISSGTGTTICANTSVTFTASAENGGSSPVYQWKKNGNNVGTNSITYTSASLVNGDVISCVMTSNATCASPATATSNTINITVNPRPTGAISGTQTICNGSQAQLNITLTGTGPWNGVLSNGLDFSGDNSTINVSVNPITKTTYTIASLSDSYCQSLSGNLTGSAVVSVRDIPTAAIEINGTNPVCFGTTSSVKFTGPPDAIIKYNIDGESLLTEALNHGGNLILTTSALTKAVTYNLIGVAYADSPSCENILQGSVTITLETTPPVWSTLPGSLDKTLVCHDAAGLTDAQALFPVATDNCQGALLPVKTSGEFAASTLCPQAGTYTNTWIVTDAAGNPGSVYKQVITLIDNIAPTFTRPADKTIYTDASCGYDKSVASTGDVTDEADNCSTGLQATYEDTEAPGKCEGSKVIIRTWSLVDNCGNSAESQIQTITVLDNIAPTFTRPADKTIYTDAGCGYDKSVASTGDVTDEADNCSTGLQATYEDTEAPGKCEGSKVITRTWSLVDNCGNSAESQIQTITVLDNIAPVITVPADINVTFNPSVCGTVVNYVVSAADNCSGNITPSMTEGLASGSVFGLGKTVVTYSATDACGNKSFKSFNVTVLPLAVTPVLTISPVTQQYSDIVRFKVVIANGASNGCANAAGSATFTVTNGSSQNMGTANFVKNGSDIEAILDAALLGGTVMAPGNKTVSVVLNGLNSSTFSVGTPNTAPLTITREDALVNFTGTSLVATSGATSGTTTVTLRATVQDITAADPVNDANAGDIRNARVRFLNGSTPITGTGTDVNGWIVPVLINSSDLKSGVVSFEWPVNIGTAMDVEYTIGIEVNNYYFRNSSSDNTVVTVYKPSGDFITGGGYVIPSKISQPAGIYSADPNSGLKTNFGFNVKYNKNGTNLQGNMNIIIRNYSSGVLHTYQIKANAMTSLGVDISNKAALKAVFVSKANLTDITNPIMPVSLGGNLKLQVNLTDAGEPGLNDQIAISLWDGSTLLYCSNWNGTAPVLTTLKGGNLVVHSGYSLNPASTSTTAPATFIREYEEGVKAYPNPFTDHVSFDLQLKTDSKVRLEIYNAAGMKLATLCDKIVKAYDLNHFEYTPVGVSSTMLFYRLIVDDELVFTGKLIHQ